MARRFGLSMRVAPETRYEEVRDAVAADWAELMQHALPEATWLPIPNVGDDAVELVEDWGIEAIILTGGNDLGQYAYKDATDRALLRVALQNGLPLLGVCRGMQVMVDRFGVPLHDCAPEAHVATHHPVDICEGELRDVIGSDRLSVNSYHRYAVPIAGLPEQLELLAVVEQWAEAVRIEGQSIYGIMWHPERDRPFRDSDRRLIRHTFRELL